jgi:acetyl esterase/lipase
MMTLRDYPPQEPLSPAGQAYDGHVTALGTDAAAGEDLAYGSDPYQRVLIYRSPRPSGAMLAFIHGGGWTNGCKEWMAFMAPAVTGAGFDFASIGYRLAPTHVFPAGVEDCADAVALLRGQTDALFLGGHSAGGHYAALLATRDGWWRRRGLAANPLSGCLPVSGVYRFGEGSGLSNRPRFLGEGPTEAQASPVLDIIDRTPFLIAHGERDFPHLIAQAAEMAAALQAKDIAVERLVLPGLDHFTASYHCGETKGAWLDRATAFITRHKRSSSTGRIH